MIFLLLQNKKDILQLGFFTSEIHEDRGSSLLLTSLCFYNCAPLPSVCEQKRERESGRKSKQQLGKGVFLFPCLFVFQEMTSNFQVANSYFVAQSS